LLAREVAAANLRQTEALAREMQTALLATPDEIPAISLGTRYVAAQDGLRVGGDWYDAIDAPGGAVLVIGDAVGHGLAATTAMGQLRSATRAAALASADPAQVLAVLDRFTMVVPDAQSTTMAVVVIDPEGDRATYACAGHLPPLLVPTAGPVVWLDEALTPPLGCGSGRSRASASVDIDRGDRIVLYTDGLIERRGELIDEGLARLCQVVAQERPDRTVEELLDRLLERCAGDGQSDDVAILVAEVAEVAADRPPDAHSS
jgi:serine phosphatase RsbU (regulator of sigma subunit)